MDDQTDIAEEIRQLEQTTWMDKLIKSDQASQMIEDPVAEDIGEGNLPAGGNIARALMAVPIMLIITLVKPLGYDQRANTSFQNCNSD